MGTLAGAVAMPLEAATPEKAWEAALAQQKGVASVATRNRSLVLRSIRVAFTRPHMVNEAIALNSVTRSHHNVTPDQEQQMTDTTMTEARIAPGKGWINAAL